MFEDLKVSVRLRIPILVRRVIMKTENCRLQRKRDEYCAKLSYPQRQAKGKNFHSHSPCREGVIYSWLPSSRILLRFDRPAPPTTVQVS